MSIHPENPRVFLSYNALDRGFADWFQTHLREAGMQVWDEGALSEQWSHAVSRAIAESDACLFVISLESVKRVGQSPLLQRELEIAVRHDKLILPVIYHQSSLVEPDVSNLPPALSEQQAVHIHSFKPSTGFEAGDVVARIVDALRVTHADVHSATDAGFEGLPEAPPLPDSGSSEFES